VNRQFLIGLDDNLYSRAQSEDLAVVIRVGAREADTADQVGSPRPLQRSVKYMKPPIDSDVLVEDLICEAVPESGHEYEGTCVLIYVSVPSVTVRGPYLQEVMHVLKWIGVLHVLKSIHEGQSQRRCICRR
jgi:hypothetical protein